MSWLSERLSALIAERGTTVDAVARQLAIERSRLNNIVAGTAIPNENLAKRLARHFGEDPDEWAANLEEREDKTPKRPAEVPPDFIKLAKTTDIREGDMKIVYHELVVIAHAEGAFYAFGNVCPHAAGPIGDGFLEGCVVECPWHAGQWDVRTGEQLTILATEDIPCFEVRIVDDDIEVKLNESVLTQGSVSTLGPQPI